MKKLIGSDIGSYAFDPLNRQVTLIGVPTIILGQLLLITNVTTGTMIYNFADNSLSGSVAENIITLDYNTTAMDSTDSLQIFIDLPEPAKENLADNGIAELLDSLTDNVPAGTMVNVAPFGLAKAGENPIQMSVPVALATEHIKDKVLQNTVALGKVGINACTQDGQVIDCLQYRSIALQIQTVASSAGGLTFEGSNDGINFVTVSMYDAANLPASTVSSLTLAASVNRFFIAPLHYRYFRARVSTVISGGICSVFTILRMASFSAPQTQNINQYGGSNVVSGGVAGMPAVGGNIAPGTAPTANPLTVGGVDTAGKVRRFLSDVPGNQAMVGPDPTFSGQAAPVLTKDVAPMGMSQQDLLWRILIELRSMSYYLKELPLHLNTGKEFSDTVSDFSDEIRIIN